MPASNRIPIGLPGGINLQTGHFQTLGDGPVAAVLPDLTGAHASCVVLLIGSFRRQLLPSHLLLSLQSINGARRDATTGISRRTGQVSAPCLTKDQRILSGVL